VDTDELEALDPLHYSPIDVNGGVLGPPFPVVHNQLLFLAEVEGEVVALAPHYQVSDLLPIGCLIIVASSANVIMVLESCAVTQTWLNREYRRGIGSALTLVLRVSEADVLLPALTT
jgi:hypothetical protein